MVGPCVGDTVDDRRDTREVEGVVGIGVRALTLVVQGVIADVRRGAAFAVEAKAGVNAVDVLGEDLDEVVRLGTAGVRLLPCLGVSLGTGFNDVLV